MAKPELIFECAVPCVLRVNGEYLGEVAEVPMRLCGTESEVLLIEGTPLDLEEYEPFCCRYHTGKGSCTSCSACRLIRWSGSCATLLFQPVKRRKHRPLSALAQLEYDDCTVTLCDDGSCYLLVECGSESMTVLPVDYPVTRASLTLTEAGGRTLIRLEAHGAEGCYFGLYEQDGRCTPFFEGIGDRFAVEGELVRMEKTCRDCAECRLVSRYRLDTERPVLYERSTLSRRRHFQKNLPLEVVPYAFLEGVKAGADTAELLLTEELAEVFSADTAQDFFGEFAEARPSPLYQDSPVVALLYSGDGGSFSVKHFAFELEGRKISNIEEK